jgi:hypothetical protein
MAIIMPKIPQNTKAARMPDKQYDWASKSILLKDMPFPPLNGEQQLLPPTTKIKKIRIPFLFLLKSLRTERRTWIP